MRAISNIVVVYKKSTYGFYSASEDTAIRKFLADNPNAEVLRKSDRAQQESLECVLANIERTGIPYRALWRGDLKEITDADLAIVIGGDGTCIETSHYVRDIPMLGVNSDPETSHGFFCAATRENFGDILASLETYPRTLVHRMGLTLDDQQIPSPILNDILIAHQNPAAMTRYKLDGVQFRGSGLLVATAAGSTAWMYQEGGEIAPLDAKNFQYFHRGIRELRPQCADRLTVESLTREGKIYADGEHWVIDFPIGSVLEISPGIPLTIIGDLAAKRK